MASGHVNRTYRPTHGRTDQRRSVEILAVHTLHDVAIRCGWRHNAGPLGSGIADRRADDRPGDIL